MALEGERMERKGMPLTVPVSPAVQWPSCQHKTITLQTSPLTVTALGRQKKCQCKRESLYPMVVGIRRYFFGSTNCHCSLSVTLTSVTVSGQACIINIGFEIELFGLLADSGHI